MPLRPSVFRVPVMYTSMLLVSLSDRNISVDSCHTKIKTLEVEFLTAVVRENSALKNTTLCSPSEVNVRFGRICRLSFQGPRIR
jgi:hypothetical protein